MEAKNGNGCDRRKWKRKTDKVAKNGYGVKDEYGSKRKTEMDVKDGYGSERPIW
jgi:hypothetical protein